MDEIRLRPIHFIAIFVFISLVGSTFSNAQVGLQTPVLNLYPQPDSSKVGFPQPVLPLRNWQDYSDQYFELKHELNQIDINQYISLSNIVPGDPFKLDMRGSSYYVPRMVRDELNFIMNRPRESAFVPILPVAFLTLQLASKYLLVQKKTVISIEDVENSKEGYPILKELWRRSPQTLSELYKIKDLSKNYTMLELKRLVTILIDNKLIKRKLIEKSETQYFYALDEFQYNQLVRRGKFEEYIPSKKIDNPDAELNIEK